MKKEPKTHSIIYELPEEEDKTVTRNSKSTLNRQSINYTLLNLNASQNQTKKENPFIKIKKNNSFSNTIQKPNSQNKKDKKYLNQKTNPEERDFLSNKSDTFGDIDNNEIQLEQINQIAYNNNKFIHFNDTLNYFCNLNLSKLKESIIVEDFSKRSCCERLFLKCSRKMELSESLKKEREIIFCIQKIGYNENDKFHFDLLTSIYFFFIKENECASSGKHWERIGFQDTMPKNDLRSVGMLALLFEINIISFYPHFTFFLYSYMKDKKCEWLFNISLIQFTKFTIDLLKSGHLIIFCKQRNSVIKTLCDFYNGLVYFFYLELFKKEKINKELTAEIISEIIQSIKAIAEKSTSDIFWKQAQLESLISSL